MDVFEQVEKNIDNLVDNSVDWTTCATEEQLQEAREGKLNLKFFEKDVPEEWLRDIKGKKVLCLAGAGGLQAPLLASAGAEVTVIDISNKMLEKDREIAKRENLHIEIVKGNMCNLSMVDDCYFDYIINPPSLMYIPDLNVVFRECYRVLKKGGIFIMMAPNPINYVCDYVNDENGGYYKAVHRMPFCSKDYDDSDWIEYGHTMEEYLGGLIVCGFVINGYVECQMDDITELHFMTRAIKG
ncbi:MAG TPA: class I SAM-dependent methyltransferase [Lachnospiraceae bacterium]|nr:class I SAM-dependent methyltransferase [Lachnospiraceae bacterium]